MAKVCGSSKDPNSFPLVTMKEGKTKTVLKEEIRGVFPLPIRIRLGESAFFI